MIPILDRVIQILGWKKFKAPHKPTTIGVRKHSKLPSSGGYEFDFQQLGDFVIDQQIFIC